MNQEPALSTDEMEQLTSHPGNAYSPGRNKPGRPPSWRLLWGGLAVAAGVFLLLSAAGFGYAAIMEENDVFCASCHTQPETTYYQRSLAKEAVDLASSHHTQDGQNTKCIGCHSGSGLFGRVGALFQGTRNAFLFFTGMDIQPAPLTVPIRDENCTKCHPGLDWHTDLGNHFHAFLARWQAADPRAAGCVDCHTSHSSGGDAARGFLQADDTDRVCHGCHAVLVLGR